MTWSKGAGSGVVGVKRRHLRLVDEYVRRLAKVVVLGDAPSKQQERDAKVATIAAVELEGFERRTMPHTAEREMDFVLSIDANRKYFVAAIEEAVGIVGLVGRWGARLDDHIIQRDDDDRSLRATMFGLKMIAPVQTQKSANLNIGAQVSDPPAGYDYSPEMDAGAGDGSDE